MGLLDFFKKKQVDDTPPAPEEEAPAHGWDAITEAFERLYPGQTNPPHRAPNVFRMNDLSEDAAAYDGVSAYDAGDYWHFVTYGLTELYAKETDDPGISGYGYEFTFRVPKLADMPPLWAFDFLEAIGKQVWKGATFSAGHTIQTGPLDGRADTREDAALVLCDPSFPDPIETPNGHVRFLLLVGVENKVREDVLASHEAQDDSPGSENSVIAAYRETNPDLITPIEEKGSSR